MRYAVLIVALVGIPISGCSKKKPTQTQITLEDVLPSSLAGKGDFITYLVEDSLYRVEAKVGESPVNLSARLPGHGEEETPAVSRNGRYVTITTNRFSPCESWSCVFLFSNKFASVETINVEGEPLRAKGRVAVSNEGTKLVYENEGGPHDTDLFIVTREREGWSRPSLLTQSSKYAYHRLPVLNHKGSRVVFDCTNDPYSQNDSHICEIDLDSRDQTVVASQGPKHSVHHADYLKGKGFVYEGDKEGEVLWVGSGKQTKKLSEKHDNDNSPCVLPSGKIASLWLGRPGGAGVHEIKVTGPKGANPFVLGKGMDVSDIGMSCHE